MLALRKFFNRPKLNDGHPMTIFYYCDQAVNHQMEELNHLMRSNPNNLDRRATLIHHLKESQHNLINVMMTLAQLAIPGGRATYHFRAKYPDDLLLDQLNGPIWFGAECIAAGSHIANHELESIELRPYAIELSKCIAKVRCALREQCFISRGTYPQNVKDLLQNFDGLWAEFEFRYVSLMCDVKSEEQYYQQQDVVVLFSESTLRALRKEYLTHDMIEMMDPIAMFAIPRLAIICGLVVCPNGPLDTSKSHMETPPCFRAFRQLMTRIKELLGYLTEEQLVTLEKALCSAEGLGTLNRKNLRKSPQQPSHPQRPVTQAEVTIGPSSQSQAATADDGSATTSYRAHRRSQSYDMDARNSSRTVFEPVPVPVESTGTTVSSSSSTVDVNTEELQFPNLDRSIDNDLPSSRSDSRLQESSGSSNGPSSSFSVAPGNLSSAGISAGPKEHKGNSLAAAAVPTSGTNQKATGKRSSHARGPGGFASAEDLMHRLFVAISGVADQLQTNHARELRMILKQVFAICQSEVEEPPLSPVREEKVGGEYPTIDPCTPEPQSPFITATAQRFTYVTSSLSIEDCPSWVPDGNCPSCYSCHERFSWRRRRHHCRNCGNVVCAHCSPYTLPLPKFGLHTEVRVCTACYIEQLGQAARSVLAQTQPIQVQ